MGLAGIGKNSPKQLDAFKKKKAHQILSEKKAFQLPDIAHLDDIIQQGSSVDRLQKL